VRFGDFCWETYAKVNQAYKVNPELAQQRSTVLHALESGHSNLAWMGALVAERIVREQLEEMKQFGIQYDVLVWESSIVRAGFWDTTFELLSKTDMFHRVTEGKLAGCWVLKNLEEGADSTADNQDYQGDKVLVRSNGILTYTAKDIAYHLWKFGLLQTDFVYKKWGDGLWSTASKGSKKPIGQADVVINVIDYRQQYPQEMVKLALEVLGYEQQASQLKHVSYGVVSLSPETAAGLGMPPSNWRLAYFVITPLN
jgi:arginyl-tRNA synthetase